MSMSSENPENFVTEQDKMILSGLDDVLSYIQGDESRVRITKVPVVDINVQIIRQKLHLTQQEFAERFKFSLATVRNWEQGRRKPEGPARILLQVIQSHPEMVANLLQEKQA
ncbi:MAG: type II toxin-antitoxin system MqsA family antitoxin [Magnetococcus sp. DMHC-1]|nr:type II toxin-antitoxin system MqsA family antitoxin [Magnetococcales bacterium]